MEVAKATIITILILGVVALVALTIACTTLGAYYPSPSCQALLVTLSDLAGALRRLLAR